VGPGGYFLSAWGDGASGWVRAAGGAGCFRPSTAIGLGEGSGFGEPGAPALVRVGRVARVVFGVGWCRGGMLLKLELRPRRGRSEASGTTRCSRLQVGSGGVFLPFLPSVSGEWCCLSARPGSRTPAQACPHPSGAAALPGRPEGFPSSRFHALAPSAPKPALPPQPIGPGSRRKATPLPAPPLSQPENERVNAPRRGHGKRGEFCAARKFSAVLLWTCCVSKQTGNSVGTGILNEFRSLGFHSILAQALLYTRGPDQRIRRDT